MARWIAVVMVALHPLPALGQADTIAALPVDSLVRLRTREFRPNRYAEPTLLFGTVQAGGRDTISLLVSEVRPANRVAVGRVALVPMENVQWLAVRQGYRRARKEGAYVGAAVGFIVGMVVPNECKSYEGEWPCIPPQPFIGAAVGAVAGALLGHVFRIERWQEVPLERLRTL